MYTAISHFFPIFYQLELNAAILQFHNARRKYRIMFCLVISVKAE